MNNLISAVLNGFAVGAGMSVPGISGGTTAIILGVYDRLLSCVSRIFSEPKKTLPFLLAFSFGGAAGLLAAAGLVASALESPLGLPLRFAFLGAVAGGIPLIFRKAQLKELTPAGAAIAAAGAFAALAIALLPQGLFEIRGGGFLSAVMQALGGVLTAAALVLPGISASHIMYVLGIYESAMQSLSAGEFLSLAPFAAGAAAGVFLTARILEKLLAAHERGCYLLILGFMSASLAELLPRGADGVQLAIGAVCALGAFAAVRALCRAGETRAAAKNDAA